MSTSTTNYGLTKPELTDAADITQTNRNWDEIDTQLSILRNVFVANSTDGLQYDVTIPGITELYNGLTITVVPNMSSADTSIQLNLNGLGYKKVRMTLPFSSGNFGSVATVSSWFSAEAPITLRYHQKMDTWKSDLQRQSADALYGKVPISNGGTGADNASDALANFGLNVVDISNSFISGGATEKVSDISVFKQGNIITGTFKINYPAHEDNWIINSNYKPKQSFVVLQTLPYNDADEIIKSSEVTAWITNIVGNVCVINYYAHSTSAVSFTVSFSYIC